MVSRSFRQFAGIHVLVLVFTLLCVSAARATAQNFRTVRDGVEHAQLTRFIAGKTVNINLLKLDLTKVRLDVYRALNKAIGTETTSSIARRNGAVAAINAGFFRLDRSIFAGDSAGILKIDRKILSESYADRAALLITNGRLRTEARIARLTTDDTIRLKNGSLKISGINRERKTDELIKYTPEFGATTPATDAGIEITVRKNRIIKISDAGGNNTIPGDGFVISAVGAAREKLLLIAKPGIRVKELSSLSIGSGEHQLTEEDRLTVRAFHNSEDITNGVPQLIKNGKVDITWQEEKSSKSFVETRHPRTAVAKLSDGRFMMITVDGRSEESGGIGLDDLAKLLLEFGAVDAMNLDGGGSTTMYLDGKVVNRPSDKEGERKVSDAIVVTLRSNS